MIVLNIVIAYCTISNCQPVPCDDRLYLATSEQTNQTSSLSQIIINPTTGKPELQMLKKDMGALLNVMGYNVYDGYIYGLNPVTYELLRIDANSNITNLGVPANIDKTLTYSGGAISPNGRTLISIGRNKDTGVDKRLLRIDLDRIYAGYLSIIADWETQVDDIAFDPEFGVLVGFDAKTRRLVNLSIGGLVTSIRFEVNNDIGNIGALFFDAKGDLYGYGGSGAEHTFYQFNKITGKAKEIGIGPSGSITEGCSCPYRITFDKTVTPAQALPCSEVTYRYHLKNTAATSFTQIDIRDTFPEDFMITAVDGLQIGEIASGVGTNLLHITQMHLLLGENDIKVKVRIGSRPGTYSSRTRVGPLPFAFGTDIISDNPTDGLAQSPTILTIINGPELIKESLLYLCPGSRRMVGANFSADQFLWNTGATDPVLEISEPGIYSVIATTECGNFYDTIRVENVATPLTVSLGENQIIEQGDPLLLNAVTNGMGTFHFKWQANGDSTLSCTDCPHPNAKPLFSSTYNITITDVNGCTATDELAVEVIPVRNIFAPTAFSPNNDGINDIFYLQGKSDAKVIYLRIFDRWGNQVFHVQNGLLNDPIYGWNGSVRSKLVSPQTFAYVAELEFPDGIRKRLQGEVSLVK